MTASAPLSLYASLLVSPDDRSRLSLHQSGGEFAFLAEGTGLLHPVIDDAAILLSREDRSCELEAPAILAFSGSSRSNPELASAAERTLALLESRRGLKSFAWEDEEHWARKYSAAANVVEDATRWNDRIWQRQELLAAANVRGTMTVVDIGCGEGQNFRSLIKDRLNCGSLYIALDISLGGLQLNRRRNGWPNAIYVVGSADHLPLASSCADLICYFGILHHTKNKEKNLPAHLEVLKPGGKIIMHEAIERARILSDRFRQGQSAHEERFDVRALRAIIASSASIVTIRFWKTMLTVVSSAAGRIFGRRVMRIRPVFKCVAAIDRACITILGPILPWCRGGEVMAVLERTGKTEIVKP